MFILHIKLADDWNETENELQNASKIVGCYLMEYFMPQKNIIIWSIKHWTMNITSFACDNSFLANKIGQIKLIHYQYHI